MLCNTPHINNWAKPNGDVPDKWTIIQKRMQSKRNQHNGTANGSFDFIQNRKILWFDITLNLELHLFITFLKGKYCPYYALWAFY